jgi:hypothetical protein
VWAASRKVVEELAAEMEVAFDVKLAPASAPKRPRSVRAERSAAGAGAESKRKLARVGGLVRFVRGDVRE